MWLEALVTGGCVIHSELAKVRGKLTALEMLPGTDAAGLRYRMATNTGDREWFRSSSMSFMQRVSQDAF